jgi:L-aminopeptidase/D-esterase-like protein
VQGLRGEGREAAACRSDHETVNSGVAPDFGPLGVVVGHATDEEGATGVTVVRGIDAPLRASAILLGRATGTRELDALSPRHLVDRVDAIMLTGGSAYGLDAAAGVMRWMEERGRGFSVGDGVVPIVPAAVVFDLAPLGRFGARPTPAMAYQAADRAAPRIEEGSIGAGAGSTVGKAGGRSGAMKGGIGAAVAAAGDVTVGALAVVNAFGDVRDASGRIIAGARLGADFIDSARLLREERIPERFGAQPLQNTTLCVVIVSTPLDRVELQQLAGAASAALFRRITPTGTTYDGDVVFALSPLQGTRVAPLHVEALAVTVLEEAIERGVRTAKGRDGVPGLADVAKPVSRSEATR